MIKQHTNFDLSERNTFRMKVRCALYIEVSEESDLSALDWDSLPRPILLMGGGSNLLFTGDFPGTVLHFAKSGGIISREAGKSQILVTIPAGTVFDDFCVWAASEGLWGPENLSLIPGEVGASAVQNIGAYGVEAKDIISAIRAFEIESRKFVEIDPASCGYAYRSSKFKTEWKGRYIITAVTFRLSRTPKPILDYGGVRKALEERGVRCTEPEDSAEGPLLIPLCGGAQASDSVHLTPQVIRETIIGIRRKKLPDPEEMGSAGSFFCNPVISEEHFRSFATPETPHYKVDGGIKVPAAWLIDQCGLKGATEGGAQVFPRQPLVIVNASGNASPQEILNLERRVIDAVKSRFGITLHPEVEHIIARYE